MPVPFKPTLVSPGQRGAANPPSVTLGFRFNAFGAGDVMLSYSIRRRVVAPLPVGAYEYWSGSAWGAAQVWVVPGSTVLDKQLVNVTSSGWNTATVYEWSVSTRSTDLSESGFANSNLLDVHQQPTVIATVSSVAETRPQIVWRFTGAANRRQKTYRHAIYSTAVFTQLGFDPSLEFWQDQAVWIMPDVGVGSQVYRVRPTVDLTNAVQYRIYSIVTDDADLSSGWQATGTFTENFVSQAPPSIDVIPKPELGLVEVTLGAGFNLLASNGGTGGTGIGTWAGDANCDVFSNYDSQFAVLNAIEGDAIRIELSGESYDSQNTRYTTFDNMKASLLTYAQLKVLQESTPGDARWSSGSVAADYATTTPGQIYGAIARVFPFTNKIFQMKILWKRAGGSGSTVRVSDATALITCPGGQGTQLSLQGMVAPSDAIYAEIEIMARLATSGSTSTAAPLTTETGGLILTTETGFSITTEGTTVAGTVYVPDTVYMDNVAFARSDNVAWNAGGLSSDVGFVIQRSDNDGLTWSYLWGNSHDKPFSANSPANFSGVYQDRAVPVGGDDLLYRASAVSKFDTNPIYSSTVYKGIPAVNFGAWWLRSFENPDLDIKILAARLSYSDTDSTQSYSPEGSGTTVVIDTTEPTSATISGMLWLIDKPNHDAALALLRSKDTLYLQRNIGDGFMFRCTGPRDVEQVRAVKLGGHLARHLHTLTFSGTIVEVPTP